METEKDPFEAVRAMMHENLERGDSPRRPTLIWSRGPCEMFQAPIRSK
jgi:hypothetical protein